MQIIQVRYLFPLIMLIQFLAPSRSPSFFRLNQELQLDYHWKCASAFYFMYSFSILVTIRRATTKTHIHISYTDNFLDKEQYTTFCLSTQRSDVHIFLGSVCIVFAFESQAKISKFALNISHYENLIIGIEVTEMFFYWQYFLKGGIIYLKAFGANWMLHIFILILYTSKFYLWWNCLWPIIF